MPESLAATLLDDINAAFIEGGVSINASSRTSDNVPVQARVVGCRVSSDRRTVTVVFPTPDAEDFLDGIRVSKQIAVVVSQPGTHRTLQLKGRDAAIVSVQKRDVKAAEQHSDAMVAE